MDNGRRLRRLPCDEFHRLAATLNVRLEQVPEFIVFSQEFFE